MKLRVLFILIFSPVTMFATIQEIQSLTEIAQIELDGHEAMAVFDIDDTLTILHEPAFQRPNFKMRYPEIFAEMMAPLSKEERLLAFTLPLVMTQGDLLEIETPEFILHFQDKGVKTIALTAALAGKFQDFIIDDRRISELKRVGIDFSNSFPALQETVFTNFQEPVIGSYPVFKQGVIFTNENDKGDVLVAFLKGLSWRPSLILFVDDRMEHLVAVEKALEAFNPEIEFKGFHFQANPAFYEPIELEHFRVKWMECIECAVKIHVCGK